MSQRHVRINVIELARCAAVATGAKTCVNIAKYPDTIYQARKVLEIHVPKVLAWCSQTHENPVGAEYIIMEEPIFLRRLEDSPSSQPLYIEANGDEITNKNLVIGPSTARENFDSGRGAIDFYRGPWDSLEAYHLSIGHRELACISHLSKLPKSPITLCGPGIYQPTKTKKLRALYCYPDLHNDLHVTNIFFDPDEPTKVVGLIDWQSTEMSPLYFHARQPYMIDDVGPSINSLERPQPRTDLDQLEPAERESANFPYLQQSLCSLYNTITHRQNPRLYTALQFQHTQKYLLLLLACNLLIDSEASYHAQVAELETTWNKFSGEDASTYPFAFSDEERQELEADVEGVIHGMEAMRSIKESLGDLFPERGD
ncbi:hypothetical protein BDU57DRAFT_559219 [Ampelomyces quisqualis]|uniref:Altered inheritance of mitochondria protein 9, mitochondrial n=1 Tax=Ampelomyces quisqualis TaxID=50730 RepID=A0A6A5QCH5_AMPQU|nr:hypothetical protein BDU57DRAFT_559219 [Ampelomyces quisqualis]